MNICIYIYDNAEVLDFSGPFEVFSTAKRLARNEWNIFFVAETDALIKARGNFLVKPHYSMENSPDIDVLVVVGGIHTEQLKRYPVISWISRMAQSAQYVVSVCTGAFLLAEAGLLHGLTATTHWEDMADLQSAYPDVKVIAGQRWVSEGNIITSGGISAGMDMSLHLVSVLSSLELAQKTARQMEYQWRQCPL